MDERRITEFIDADRLVETVLTAVGTPSPTGEEAAMAALVSQAFEGIRLETSLQEVEPGRLNVLGVRRGEGDGASLMLNGHMDTSYSGKEPWLAGIPGFQPKGFVEDGHIYGLGVANMKGALCAYVEAVQALNDAGVRLGGDLLVAAVSGEIEKTQWGDEFRGAMFRGYAAGSRHLVYHGGVADYCILGEPTEHKIVLAHFGAMWARISTRGPFIHTAFTRGREDENSIVRMLDVIEAVREWIPALQVELSHGKIPGIVNIGALRGGLPWRVSRTPHRTDLFLDVRVPPAISMAKARARLMGFVNELRQRFPDHGIEAEVFLTAPGAEITEDEPVVAAVDEAHTLVHGSSPERDVTHWFSDASVLSRYGIQTVNYGASSGLPNAVKGENVEIQGLIDVAKVYALAATRICGVAA